MKKTFASVTVEEVHEALRLWHKGMPERWPLSNLRLSLLLYQEAEAHGSLAEAGPAALNRAVLEKALTVLAGTRPDAAALLRARFEHGQDAVVLANSFNIAESSFYYRQRQAIEHLTAIINELEAQASKNWQKRMLNRLQPPSYAELVGVEEARETIIKALMAPDNHFIVAIDGLGGIGKTALADQVTRDLINTPRFQEIAWITAKQTHLSTLGRLQIDSGRPALTFPMLIDELSKQFDLPVGASRSVLDRQRLVRRFLRERACLIVIDNLETVADYRLLLPELRQWLNPTKFLLTSRLRLLDEPDVFSYSLRELSWEAALQLIRMEARRSGFMDLMQADEKALRKIYEVVGGNPLALKLVVGQLRFHSLSYVLERFVPGQEVRGEQDLFDYIYSEIWETLSSDSKVTLLALTQAGETGFTFDHLVAVSGLPVERVSVCLQELILLSLVDTGGSLTERRYRLHRLTEVFLLRALAEE
ncbi:MAG: hypothetical protein D6706_12675 [Chloroflexi bacterium]|nr:MAG: hypothetical protein D6706_12675 [Chloroflexota bacterium]